MSCGTGLNNDQNSVNQSVLADNSVCVTVRRLGRQAAESSTYNWEVQETFLWLLIKKFPYHLQPNDTEK